MADFIEGADGRCVVCRILAELIAEADPAVSFDEAFQRMSEAAHPARPGERGQADANANS